MNSAVLNLADFAAALKTRYLGRGANECHEEIDSTNNRAAVLAAQDAVSGTVIMARSQSAGRGRQGRQWVSPLDGGLAFSAILRPNLPLNKLPLVTLAAGNAVCRAARVTCGVELGLKWVNDLTAQGKKVGGILAEKPLKALIVGIGINIRLNRDELPDEIKDRVDWLENLAGMPVDTNLLAAALCQSLEEELDKLEEQLYQAVIDDRKRNSVTLGKTIKATYGGAEIMGVAKDIGESGALIVEKTGGEIVELSAGEISIRMADGSYC